MCKRDGDDPLGKLFFEDYRLHVLRLPRQNIHVGDVFVVEAGDVSMSGALTSLIGDGFELPKVNRNEVMADVSRTTSRSIQGDGAVSWLGEFLSALGVGAAVRLSAGIKATKAYGLRFAFSDAKRDSVDAFGLERRLRKTPSRDSTVMRDGCRYYVALGVLRSNCVSFMITQSEGRAVAVDLGALGLGEVSAGIDVTKTNDEVVTVAGPHRLAFGVQLSELTWNEEHGRLELGLVKHWIKVMSREEEGRVPYDLIPDADGELLYLER